MCRFALNKLFKMFSRHTGNGAFIQYVRKIFQKNNISYP